jgi:hypothetical protein
MFRWWASAKKAVFVGIGHGGVMQRWVVGTLKDMHSSARPGGSNGRYRTGVDSLIKSNVIVQLHSFKVAASPSSSSVHSHSFYNFFEASNY